MGGVFEFQVATFRQDDFETVGIGMWNTAIFISEGIDIQSFFVLRKVVFYGCILVVVEASERDKSRVFFAFGLVGVLSEYLYFTAFDQLDNDVANLVFVDGLHVISCGILLGIRGKVDDPFFDDGLI